MSESPQRREGESDDRVYDGFDEIRDKGMALRALQLAWNILEKHQYLIDFYKFQNMNDESLKYMISDLMFAFFDEISLSMREEPLSAYGFRESDERVLVKERDHPFRKAVERCTFIILKNVIAQEKDVDFANDRNPAEERVRAVMEREIQAKIEKAMQGHKKEDIQEKRWRGMLVRIEKYFAAKKKYDEYNGEDSKEYERLRLEMDECRESLRLVDKAVKKWAERVRTHDPDGETDIDSYKRSMFGAMKLYREHGLGGCVEAINHDARGETEGKGMHEVWGVKKAMQFFGNSFVPGTDPVSASRNGMIKRLAKKGIDFTYARELEGTGDPELAKRNFELVAWDDIESVKCLPKEHRHMSVKMTALGMAEYDGTDLCDLNQAPKINKRRMKRRLKSIAERAKEHDVFVRIDMEQFIYKDATFEIFLETLEELCAKDPAFAEHLGMVFQTYLVESHEDADEIIKRADELNAKFGIKIRLRAVKGANRSKDNRLMEKGFHSGLTTAWHGRDRTAKDWAEFQTSSPIAKSIIEVGGQMKDISRKFEAAENIVIDYGTHNPNTIAAVRVNQMNTGTLPEESQIQSLMGVDNPLKFALDELGFNQRVYVPYEEIELVAEYLWRRFEEYMGESTKPAVENVGGEWMEVAT